MLKTFTETKPKEAALFTEFFGAEQTQEICNLHIGRGAEVQQIRFFYRPTEETVLVPLLDVTEIPLLHRADVTLWNPDKPHSRTLLQLHRTETIDAYHYMNQSQAYDGYAHEKPGLAESGCTNLLYPRIANSMYYVSGSARPSSIVEWSITDYYDFSLFECIKENSGNEKVLKETMEKVWVLFMNMHHCGLVHGSMTPCNVVFNMYMQMSAGMLSSETQTVISPAKMTSAKLTFLNNCLGAHQTMFVMHLYDVLVFLKSACQTMATLASTCKPISSTLCAGLAYMGKNRDFLVNPDLTMLPNYASSLGNKAQTKLEGILQDANGQTLTEFPSAENCIDGTTVQINWKALNKMGNFIHAYIFRTENVSSVGQVCTSFTQLIQEDKHEALTEIVRHLANTHKEAYIGHKMEVTLPDGREVTVAISNKEKKKPAATKKTGNNNKQQTGSNKPELVVRPMGYYNVTNM